MNSAGSKRNSTPDISFNRTKTEKNSCMILRFWDSRQNCWRWVMNVEKIKGKYFWGLPGWTN